MGEDTGNKKVNDSAEGLNYNSQSIVFDFEAFDLD